MGSPLQKGAIGTAEYADTTARWNGPGKNEFRENVACAFADRSRVRLVVVSTVQTERIEAGENASNIKKNFDV